MEKPITDSNVNIINANGDVHTFQNLNKPDKNKINPDKNPPKNSFILNNHALVLLHKVQKIQKLLQKHLLNNLILKEIKKIHLLSNVLLKFLLKMPLLFNPILHHLMVVFPLELIKIPTKTTVIFLKFVIKEFIK